MEGDSSQGGEHTIQYTDDVLQNCTPETYIILLTNATPIKSIKRKEKKNKSIKIFHFTILLVDYKILIS